MDKFQNNRMGGSPKGIEDELLLKGEAQFLSDLTCPNMVYAGFLRSHYAHARILKIDCSEAEIMPGVIIILTGHHCRKDSLGTIQPFAVHKRKDGTDMFIPENLPLSDSKVVFVGDPIAVVIASTKTEADLACEAIKVEFEELDAVTEISEALQDNAPLVWPENGTNECFFWSKGNREEVKKIEKNAEVVINREFVIPLASANPIEPRGCIAEYNSKTAHFTLTAPVQSPWKVRQILASQSLSVSEKNISVVCPNIGGSFGMKGQTYNEYAVCLWAARKIGKPIKWVASRMESFLSDDQGRNVSVKASLSLKSDGKFLSMYVSGVCGLGAYLSTRGTKTSIDNWPGVSGVYKFNAVYSEISGVFTNTPSISPYRGAGRPEAAYVIERLVDLAARKLKMSQIKIREINFINANEMPFKNNLGFTYDSGDYLKSLSDCKKISNWNKFQNRKEKSLEKGLLRGRGVASVVERSMSGQPEYASIKVNKLGSITLACGAISFGQGPSTIFPQILREVLDINNLRINYLSGDTRKISKGTGSFGSRSAGLAGAAVAYAGEKLIKAGKIRAADFLQDTVKKIKYEKGWYNGESGGSIHLLSLAQDSELFVEAEYETKMSTFPSGTHICEVELDPDTGKVYLASYFTVEDAGTVINPIRLDGQMHGGVAQGVGQTLMEIVKYDASSGQLTTGSFMDYAMPRASDFPFFNVGHNPNPSPFNPLGIKGGGEGGTVGSLVCVANAISDSLATRTNKELPIPATPFNVWKLLNSPSDNSRR